MSERLDRACEELVGLVRPSEDIQRNQRVDRAVDTDGRVDLSGRDFLPVKSPDGSTWRIRVDNSGTLTATKVTP